MLACLVVMVRVTTQLILPPYTAIVHLPHCDLSDKCDTCERYGDGLVLMKAAAPSELAKKYLADGDKSFVWFCPAVDKQETYNLDVYSCASGQGDNDCLMKTEKVIGGTMQMNECKDLISYYNFVQRVSTCMPWEVSPNLKKFKVRPTWAKDESDENVGMTFEIGMRHIRTQFQDKFKPVWQWWETPPTPQDARVSSCASSTEDIQFASEACWHSDAAVVFLRPRYKFKTTPSNQKQLCVLSNTVVGTDVLSYNSDVLTYTPQSAGIEKKITFCKWWGKDLEWWQEITRDLVSDEWHAKQIQYLDYKSVKKSTPCTDSVTQPCIDNVFSFFASECVWVRTASADKPHSLSAMLESAETEAKESFETYGDKMYVMNLADRNIEAWVSLKIAQGWEKWNGVAKNFNLTARLYFSEKPLFSCTGCQSSLGTVLASSPSVRKAPCGVAQQCVECGAWQRVEEPGTWSDCIPSFAERKCKACPDHHVRSSADEQLCEVCPSLTPMRQTNMAVCTKCEHTQYFDGNSVAGCVYFASVADGLVFMGGALLDARYIDKYRPPGSTLAPEAVPAQHYRHLAADGNDWTASTSAQRCSAVSVLVLNASVSGVFTRNVFGRRVQYRRFCGHAEMLRSGDAMVQPLDCAGGAVALTELVRDSGAFMTKERRLVDNRMAEIKRTVAGASCFYEIRREGRTDDCQYCMGTQYTKDCGPTYYAALAAPSSPGAGTCAECETACSGVAEYFAASEFSCWSNGTQRVQGSAVHGSLEGLKGALSKNMNYWYKPAECRPCARLSETDVPAIVTRCGNKATFETWHDKEEEMVLDVPRPQRIVCCVLDSSGTSIYYNSKKLVRCVPAKNEAVLGMTGNTPLCQPNVPDLETAFAPFCPPGWFLDRSAPGCKGVLAKWSNACCSRCEGCVGAGRLQTNEYRTCPGDTVFDTQLAGCVTTCAEKNYEVDGTCIACESCA